MPNDLSDARLLIVDDEDINLRVLQRILQRGGAQHMTCLNDSRLVIDTFVELQPDIVLLDLNMPHVNGFEIMQQLKPLIPEESFVPILVLTADITPDTKQRALSEGATDFVTKPFDAIEVTLRIKNLLRTRFLNRHLEERVVERTREIKETQLEILQRLSQAAEYRDDDTGQHTQRVGRMAMALTLALGLSEDCVKLIGRAAPLHDVGKIGIPDGILLKPGKLTNEEFDRMKEHTTIGAAMLQDSRSELLQSAERIALSHHEKWSGGGYPQGLKEESIPIEGRILAVADVFDALTHERPYKTAWTVEDAVAEIERSSGTHFDPQVVVAFLTLPHAEFV